MLIFCCRQLAICKMSIIRRLGCLTQPIRVSGGRASRRLSERKYPTHGYGDPPAGLYSSLNARPSIVENQPTTVRYRLTCVKVDSIGQIPTEPSSKHKQEGKMSQLGDTWYQGEWDSVYQNRHTCSSINSKFIHPHGSC